MTEIEVEEAIKAKGLVAPRITPELVNEQIKITQFWRVPNSTVTVCALTMQNNFVLVGKSAAASFANFDEEIGKSLALADAREQIWSHLGYKLRDDLYTKVIDND